MTSFALFTPPLSNVQTRYQNFENPRGAKGAVARKLGPEGACLR